MTKEDDKVIDRYQVLDKACPFCEFATDKRDGMIECFLLPESPAWYPAEHSCWYFRPKEVGDES